ncbi:MAG: hypothetical protein B7C24_15360 [Bacteroidetes bacterium 4572_77]|nr:MAG: hypothetical protein B7C24_15360 [Bacteroidetes bacterium 4572_77]
MTEASDTLIILENQVNENYALKVLSWLKKDLDIPWDNLKKLLTKTFSNSQMRLRIVEVDCDQEEVEMWSEQGTTIYVCRHILFSGDYSSEDFKAKLLHELSHVIRQRDKHLNDMSVGKYFSGREYPARAFEVAWCLSLKYQSLDDFLIGYKDNQSNALGLYHTHQVLRDVTLMLMRNSSPKFIKLCNLYTKVLYGFRKRNNQSTSNGLSGR